MAENDQNNNNNNGNGNGKPFNSIKTERFTSNNSTFNNASINVTRADANTGSPISDDTVIANKSLKQLEKTTKILEKKDPETAKLLKNFLGSKGKLDRPASVYGDDDQVNLSNIRSSRREIDLFGKEIRSGRDAVSLFFKAIGSEVPEVGDRIKEFIIDTGKSLGEFRNITKELKKQYDFLQELNARGQFEGFTQLLYNTISPAWLLSSDNLLNVTETLKKNFQETGATPVGVLGSSLENIGKDLRQSRNDLIDSGVDVYSKFSADQFNEISTNFQTALARQGFLGTLSKDKTQELLKNQLDNLVLISNNTGLTVDEIRKRSETIISETEKAVSTQKFSPEQIASVRKAITETASVFGEQSGKDLAKVIQFGNNAIFALKDQLPAINASGSGPEFIEAIENLAKVATSGNTNPQILNEALENYRQAAINVKNGTKNQTALFQQLAGLPGASEVQTRGIEASQRTEKLTENGIFGNFITNIKNRIDDFLTSKVPALKAITALGANTIALIANTAAIAALTGRLAGGAGYLAAGIGGKGGPGGNFIQRGLGKLGGLGRGIGKIGGFFGKNSLLSTILLSGTGALLGGEGLATLAGGIGSGLGILGSLIGSNNASTPDIPEPEQLGFNFGKTGVKEAEKIGAKGLGKFGLKGLGKSLLKKIPFLGIGAGALFAAQKAFAGDFTGAGLELASGAASTIPGIGTAASLGIDAAIAARDYNQQYKDQNQSLTNNISSTTSNIPLTNDEIESLLLRQVNALEDIKKLIMNGNNINEEMLNTSKKGKTYRSSGKAISLFSGDDKGYSY